MTLSISAIAGPSPSTTTRTAAPTGIFALSLAQLTAPPVAGSDTDPPPTADAKAKDEGDTRQDDAADGNALPLPPPVAPDPGLLAALLPPTLPVTPPPAATPLPVSAIDTVAAAPISQAGTVAIPLAALVAPTAPGVVPVSTETTALPVAPVSPATTALPTAPVSPATISLPAAPAARATADLPVAPIPGSVDTTPQPPVGLPTGATPAPPSMPQPLPLPIPAAPASAGSLAPTPVALPATPAALQPVPLAAASPAAAAQAAPIVTLSTMVGAPSAPPAPAPAPTAAPSITIPAAAPIVALAAPVSPTGVTIDPAPPAPLSATTSGNAIAVATTDAPPVVGTIQIDARSAPIVALSPPAPAASVQGIAGTPAAATSAIQAFGAAMRAGMAKDPRSDAGTDAAQGPLAPGTATRADQIPAVVATGDAQQAPLDLRRDQWPHAMIDRIEALRDAADATSTKIRVVPDALGPVELSVRKQGDTLHVHFSADQAATRAILTDAQPRLAAIAEQRGLKLGGSTVDGGSTGAGAGQQQQQATSRQRTAPLPSSPSVTAMSAADDDTRIA